MGTIVPPTMNIINNERELTQALTALSGFRKSFFTFLGFTMIVLDMSNVSKVISVLEEAADMLKSAQTESNADQGSGASTRAACPSSRSEFS